MLVDQYRTAVRQHLTEIGPSGTGPAGTPRQGPRPLFLHLVVHLWMAMNANIALPLLKKELLPWNPVVAPAARGLMDALSGVDPDAFARAVDAETRRRSDAFLTGLALYRHHPYQRRLADPPVIWQEGTTRLLDYSSQRGQSGCPQGFPLLVVPSLVNRAYVLDLSERHSFMRTMAKWGFCPYLIDWQAPGDAERKFGWTEYIAGRLHRLLDVVVERVQRPVAVVGYCMGGLLALGLAVRRPEAVGSLTCLATPWDFHAPRGSQMPFLQALRPWLDAVIAVMGELPVDVLQTLFFNLDPGLAERKFRVFATLASTSAKAEEFVALEDWLNDGIPLAGPVAQDCLFGWYGENSPLRRRWCVAGEPVLPESATMPAMLVIPEQDRIVPPPSAMALADSIPGSARIMVAAGHISMMTSTKSTSLLYRPLAEWIIKNTLK
ncbi:MAG: polyhydroxyalkanoate synthase [Rhodospirillaceae bacterium]|nr:MAG: polyhydroxyalkanoate synthase [Rhodospirillaceae bacterium]